MAGAGFERKQRKSAYRTWYSTLHPSLQLIGLQLWMPLFFIVMFCLCYVGSFHTLHVADVPIAVVGDSSALRATADEQSPGTFAFTEFADDDSADAAVLSGSMAVAYDVEANTLAVASAHQAQVVSLVPKMLDPLLGTDTPPTTVELAPLPANDTTGMVSMYLMLTWCIGGYMTAMFIGLMGGPLRVWTRIATILTLGAVISLVTNVLVGPVLGAVTGDFWRLALTAWGWIVAIGLTVNGLSYFFGRFIALPAMVIFVFLSVPSSGAAMPAWFMPEPFRWLNNVVVGSGITEMLKRELYGVGPGIQRGVIMMASYALIGLILSIVGKWYWEGKRVRMVVNGRTTMFGDAQAANRDHLTAERHRILERHGLESTKTGTIRTVDLGDEIDDDALGRSFIDAESAGDVLTGNETGLQPTLDDDRRERPS